MNDKEKLIIAVEAYAQARDAYFSKDATESLETLRNVYDCAAHRVAFLMWLDHPMHETPLPSAHPDFQRLLESIEQHDPLAAPAYLTDQNAFEDTMEDAYWQHNALNVQARCIHNDPECPNTGWPVACSKCNYCSQNMEEDTMEPEPGELSGGTECRDCGTRYLLDDDARCPRCAAAKEGIEDPVPDADSSDWTTAATEEDIQSWASDSRDLFDEEEEPVHAIKEPFGDKCFCPYCNSECAPDFCSACHSELTPPAIEPETRPDLPDEPPF